MIPTMDTPLSDFQELFRVHVHENRILQGNVRDLEKQKVKLLKDMGAESRQFKSKYTKYLERGRRRSFQDIPLTPRYTDSGEVNVSVSRDMICKNCPYSFKTWNNLVDVKRNGIDAYKSEILFGDRKEKKLSSSYGNVAEHSRTGVEQNCVGMVTEIPGFRENIRHSSKRLSASASALLEIVNTENNSPKASPRLKRSCKETIHSPVGRRVTQEISAKDCQELLSLHRSKTIPTIDTEYSPRTESPRTNNTVNLCVPRVDVENVTDDTDGASYRRRGSFSLQDDAGELDTPTERARSYTIDNHQRPVLLARRRTQDIVAYSREGRRSSVGTIALKAMADSSKGLTKFKYFTKLLADTLKGLPQADLEDESPAENKSIPDIYESLKKCRYLRTPPRSRRGSNVDQADFEGLVLN